MPINCLLIYTVMYACYAHTHTHTLTLTLTLTTRPSLELRYAMNATGYKTEREKVI